ncbi:MAG: DUF2378 family protein [Archangium sp.]
MSTIPGKLVEGLFNKVLAPDVSPALKTQLAEAGVDLSAPPPPTYSRATWYRAIELTAASVFPSDAPPEQLRKLGSHIIESLQTRGIIKGAWLSMARLMGPRRALRQAMDFLDRSPVKLEITERSKTEFEIYVDDPEQPEFLAGLLQRAITLLGGKDAAVSPLLPRPGASVFRATWR